MPIANCWVKCWPRSHAEQIFEKIKKFSTVDEIEVIFSSTDFSLTRFANNTIHQNVAEVNEAASIRVAFDGKTARATTNRFDDEGLKRAVQSAESIAKVQEPDPDFLPMAKPAKAKARQAHRDGRTRQQRSRQVTGLKVSEKLWQSQRRTSW